MTVKGEYQAMSDMYSGFQEGTFQFIIKTHKVQKPQQLSKPTCWVIVEGPDKGGRWSGRGGGGQGGVKELYLETTAASQEVLEQAQD